MRPQIVSHDNLVFSDKQSATVRDLNKTIGRYNNGEVEFLDDNQLGTKWKALHQAGFKIHLAKDKNNNWYITDLIDNLSKVNPYTESMEDTKFVDEDEFLKKHNDGAIDIMFTTPSMKHFHRVGLINLDDNVYTLQPQYAEDLEDFEYEIDDEQDEIFASVMTDSIVAPKLLKLQKALQQEDKEDDDLNESIDVRCLANVKNLMASMSVARRLGDIKSFNEIKSDLLDELDTLEKGDAVGINELKAEIAQLEKEAKPTGLNERETESIQINSILEASGIQLRGQQYA
ncbi:hypothetical protein [Vibrio vulnificus]|uniref:hypothetical protein n=1 Tax=Vibrio vulnificus TaxID=672 RepID=UPI0028C1E1AB|nr:hypothetical protein [Vibrio vulnificus]